VFEVFGTDHPTPDGTCVRDYIHVTDLARAHVAALRYLAGGGDIPAFNLGTGQGHSIREMMRAVQDSSGCSVPHREIPRRAGDPPSLVADASLARANLGWIPQLSDPATICGTAWRWHTSRNATVPD
jgi:UDP-glucose 4-epimerase